VGVVGRRCLHFGVRWGCENRGGTGCVWRNFTPPFISQTLRDGTPQVPFSYWRAEKSHYYVGCSLLALMCRTLISLDEIWSEREQEASAVWQMDAKTRSEGAND